MRTSIRACGESVVRVRAWAAAPLFSTCEQLAKGVEVYGFAECTNVRLYAALYAAGYPRLAFLLTDLDPRDRIDEEIASWKLWLVRAAKHTRMAMNPIDVIDVMLRWVMGEISDETARELLSKRETVLRVGYEGFLIPNSYLHRPDDDVVEELWVRARKGDPYAAARLAVDAELERLARMAEAGFPIAPKAIDRFVDTLGELGFGLRLLEVEEELPRERLRELEERGVGGWTESGRFDIVACRADQVPEELKQGLLDNLVDALKKVVGLVVPIRVHRLYGYIFMYYEA
ncbi:MAG: hypothetical protein LM580_09400 [Thermofilum sp.]|nr:hypothetical protein [Thermofilum sp.]